MKGNWKTEVTTHSQLLGLSPCSFWLSFPPHISRAPSRTSLQDSPHASCPAAQWMLCSPQLPLHVLPHVRVKAYSIRPQKSSAPTLALSRTVFKILETALCTLSHPWALPHPALRKQFMVAQRLKEQDSDTPDWPPRP